MSDFDAGSVLGGAAQGAATGAAVGGPVGAVVGGVLGAIGGFFGGSAKKKAKKYGAKAAAVRRQQQQMKAAVQRRDVIRQMRMQRAQAVAAGASEDGVTSSSVLGAISSVDSQGMGAVSYFDSQIGLDNQYQAYAAKAGKYAGQASDINEIMGAVGSLVNTGRDIYGLMTTPKDGSYTSFNNSAAVSNMQGNSAFTTFGSSLELPT